MLRHLTIAHLAVIDKAEIEFTTGFNVITGETGAGKSLILNALRFGLGQKNQAKKLVHPDVNLCVTMEFDLHHNVSAANWLTEHDYQILDNSLTIRRLLMPSGRQKTYLNDQPATIAILSELSGRLFHIHGQHDTLLLGQRQTQRKLLDSQVSEATVTKMSHVYEQYQQVCKALERLSQEQLNSQHLALLEYQLQELDQLNLQEDELSTLEQKHQQCLMQHQMCQEAQELIDLLNKDDKGILPLLSQARQAAQVKDKTNVENKVLCDHLEQAEIELIEAHSFLETKLDALLQLDVSEQSAIEARLQKIYDIARKHQVKASELFGTWQALAQEYKNLADQKSEVSRLESDIKRHLATYHEVAMELSTARINAAKKLSGWLTKNMQALAMQGAKCQIEVRYDATLPPSRHGSDKINFLLQSNPGQPMQLLSDIASGGELSRISLCFQKLVAKLMPAVGLFFDEIDTGIGGEVGGLLGREMHSIAQHQQTICITHLPQIAALADHHLVVKKFKQKNNTYTTVSPLPAEARVEELARMLGDASASAAIEHAKSLLAETAG